MSERINNEFILKDSGCSNYEKTIELPRHRWYYYKEGFSPTLVEKAIEQAGVQKNELIIDPFNGSGTTTLTSSISEHKSVGIEVNPFTSFLADAKIRNASLLEIKKWKRKLLKSTITGAKSPLLGFSTFSKSKGLDKWLFNDSVLNAFEGGWESTKSIPSYGIRRLLRLSLISSAMQNCNARRDGKCLRYRESWKQKKFNKESFIESLELNLSNIIEDIEVQPINQKAIILNEDCRNALKISPWIESFKLCVTSPPYLNTFDYTDIYRPELFLGKFIKNANQLYNLRLETVRSHIQVKWKKPIHNDFGILYEKTMQHINENKESLMDKNIPLMIQAYFEDMLNVMKLLKIKASKNAEVWLVVSNSAYAGHEIPVDLILGDISAKAGWYLKEIGVLRYLKKRKTKYSTNINQLRESVVILSNNKKIS